MAEGVKIVKRRRWAIGALVAIVILLFALVIPLGEDNDLLTGLSRFHPQVSRGFVRGPIQSLPPWMNEGDFDLYTIDKDHAAEAGRFLLDYVNAHPEYRMEMEMRNGAGLSSAYSNGSRRLYFILPRPEDEQLVKVVIQQNSWITQKVASWLKLFGH